MKIIWKIQYLFPTVILLLLTGCPPFPVTILSPADGDHFECGESITFTGFARDLLEGELSEDALVWTSNIDGQIGTGNSFSRNDLSEGTHLITLTATNSMNEQGTATITITVGGSTPPTTTVSSSSSSTAFTTSSTVPPQSGSGALVLSTDADNDLLFYVTHQDGYQLFYHGFETEGTLELTHITDSEGMTVIFNEDLLPFQWIAPGLTIITYKDDDMPFDPHHAYHEVNYGDSQETVTINIYPDDLTQIITEMEITTGKQFDQVLQFLTSHSLSSFADLVTRAKQSGQDQARFIAATTGLSAAAAYLSLKAQEGVSSSTIRDKFLQAPWEGLVSKFVAGMLAAKLNEAFGPTGPSDPEVPVVEVLLCRGVAKFGLCHYLFFLKEDLGECVSLCYTSLRCFTDICMPGYTIDAETALRCRNHYLGSGQ